MCFTCINLIILIIYIILFKKYGKRKMLIFWKLEERRCTDESIGRHNSLNVNSRSIKNPITNMSTTRLDGGIPPLHNGTGAGKMICPSTPRTVYQRCGMRAKRIFGRITLRSLHRRPGDYCRTVCRWRRRRRRWRSVRAYYRRVAAGGSVLPSIIICARTSVRRSRSKCSRKLLCAGR